VGCAWSFALPTRFCASIVTFAICASLAASSSSISFIRCLSSFVAAVFFAYTASPSSRARSLRCRARPLA
jgi:hypothetical protein